MTWPTPRSVRGAPAVYRFPRHGGGPQHMSAQVAIVDTYRGNLRSTALAAKHVGRSRVFTQKHHRLREAGAVTLPRVGAFGDIMAVLEAHDQVSLLCSRAAAANRYLIGIGFGMRLPLSERHEFGRHAGIGRVAGEIRRLAPTRAGAVPEVGWSRIQLPAPDRWHPSPLEDVSNGECVDFTHACYAASTALQTIVLAICQYAGIDHCSAVTQGSMVGFRLQPERSCRALAMYSNLAATLDPY